MSPSNPTFTNYAIQALLKERELVRRDRDLVQRDKAKAETALRDADRRVKELDQALKVLRDRMSPPEVGMVSRQRYGALDDDFEETVPRVSLSGVQGPVDEGLTAAERDQLERDVKLAEHTHTTREHRDRCADGYCDPKTLVTGTPMPCRHKNRVGRSINEWECRDCGANGGDSPDV